MTLLLVFLFLILPVAGGLTVLSVARRAPRGSEDEHGFHLIATGEEEDQPQSVVDSTGEDCGIGQVATDGHPGTHASA